ncbi:MAG TPA: TraR/DksA C4-type zinc finger protein [Longimicrobium sp.]|nr:TraR/DksA C4-type zinc finger protein [Longimicrobium sp.]
MLQDFERTRIEHRLLREREEALDAIEHFDERAESLRDRAGELSLYRLHPADLGSESNEQEQDAFLASAEGRRLYQIDEALSRLYKEPERFGLCEVCGRDIGVERLEIIPETRLCAEHARAADEAAGVDANPREAGPPVA